MGSWSRLAGEVFLDWLAPPPGLRWIDVGCGNGAFTELLVERCAPAEVQGIDPSEGQLAFARTRPAARVAQFRQGDAMALPFPDDAFDAAVMALVIFFVPDPAKGVAEMARVVRPGGTSRPTRGTCSAAAFPTEPIQAEMRGDGRRPSAAAERRGVADGRAARACGRGRASTRSRRGRSPCSGRSPISTISGRPPRWARASARQARGDGRRRSRAPEGAGASAPAGGCRRAASPVAHAPTRSRVGVPN